MGGFPARHDGIMVLRGRSPTATTVTILTVCLLLDPFEKNASQ